MSYNNYKIYDSAQSTSCLYNIMLLGILTTSTMAANTPPKVDKNVYIKSQSSFIPEIGELTLVKENIDILNLVRDSLSQIQNAQFDFLNVDEALNNDINKYISSYSGKNKEILEF